MAFLAISLIVVAYLIETSHQQCNNRKTSSQSRIVGGQERSNLPCLMPGNWNKGKTHLDHIREWARNSSHPDKKLNAFCQELLTEAVISRRPQVVKLLIALGANVQQRDSRHRTVQTLAFRLGYFEILNSLMNVSRTTIDSRLVAPFKTAKGPSALMVAMCKGRAQTVATLLKNGAQLLPITSEDELLCSIRGRFPWTSMALMAHGKLTAEYFTHTDSSSINQNLVYATYYAGTRWPKFYNVARKMMELGARPINANSNPLPVVLLSQAVPVTRTDIVALIYQFEPVELNRKGSGGIMALHKACQRNLTEMATFLVNSGANMLGKTQDNDTPLHFCAYFNALQIAKMFLKRKASIVDAKNNDAETPLMMAAQTKSANMAKLLLDYGASVNASNVHGVTSLMTAAGNGDIETVQALLNGGANVNAVNNVGKPPLMFAIENNAPFMVVQLLVNHSAKVRASDIDGKTALMYSVSSVNLESVKLLLENGADVNAADIDGNTALHLATSLASQSSVTSESAVKIMEVLLQNGANVHLRNSDGQSAYSTAKKEPLVNNRTWELLLRYGASMVNDSSADYGGVKYAKPPSQNSTMPLQNFRNYPLRVVRTNRTSSKTQNLAVLVQLFAMGSFCMMDFAAKEMLNLVNNMEQVLPGFSLEFHYLHANIPNGMTNEVEKSYILRRDLVHAFDSFTDPQYATADTFRFPIVVGPKYGCMLDWGTITPDILRAMEAQRKTFQFSTVYLDKCQTEIYQNYETDFKSPLENKIDGISLAVLGLLSFIKSKKFGFDWRQVGLISDTRAGDSGASQMAKYSGWLTANAIKVVDSQFGTNFTQLFEAMKASHARILFIVNSYESTNKSVDEICEICAEIVCSSYWAGLRNDSYAILLQSSYCWQGRCLSGLPNLAKCPPSSQIEQLSMFFFGFQQQVFKTITALSYKVEHFFEPLWDDSLEQAKEITNNCRGAGISRMLKTTIFLLHTIALKYQRSKAALLQLLSDGLAKQNASAARDLQKIILDAAIDSQLRLSSSGDLYKETRTVNIIQINFDYAKADVDMWQDFSELRLVATVAPLTKTDELNLNFTEHNITSHQSVIWPTRNGQPPSDLSHIFVIDASFHESSFTAVTAIGGSLSLLLFGLAILSVKTVLTSNQRTAVYFDLHNNIFILTGCIFVNTSALTMLTGTKFYASIMCYFRPFFTVLGLSTVNVTLLVKMIAMPSFVREHRYISRKFRQQLNFNLRDFEKKRRVDINRRELNMFVVAFLAIMVVIILVGTWMVTDPIILKSSIEHAENPVYDPHLDSLITYRKEWCESENQFAWITFFAALQATCLAVAGVIGMSLKRSLKSIRKRWKPEVQNLRMAVINSATVSVFVSLLMVVVPTKPASLWYLQTLVFAVGGIAFSASTCAIIFFEIWSPVINFTTLFAKLASPSIFSRLRDATIHQPPISQPPESLRVFASAHQTRVHLKIAA